MARLQETEDEVSVRELALRLMRLCWTLLLSVNIYTCLFYISNRLKMTFIWMEMSLYFLSTQGNPGTVLYHTVLYCTVLYCTNNVLCCTVLYCTT